LISEIRSMFDEKTKKIVDKGEGAKKDRVGNIISMFIVNSHIQSLKN